MLVPCSEHFNLLLPGNRCCCHNCLMCELIFFGLLHTFATQHLHYGTRKWEHPTGGNGFGWKYFVNWWIFWLVMILTYAVHSCKIQLNLMPSYFFWSSNHLKATAANINMCFVLSLVHLYLCFCYFPHNMYVKEGMWTVKFCSNKIVQFFTWATS